MPKYFPALLGALVVLLMLGCSDIKTGDASAIDTAGLSAMEVRAKEVMKRDEFANLRIKIDHILISADRNGDGKKSQPEIEEAKQIAIDIYEKAIKAEDFSAYAREVDEKEPGNAGGPYELVQGRKPKTGESARSGMVKSFGNVGWRLKVGEIGVAEYDKDNSPHGWHIIKRLE